MKIQNKEEWFKEVREDFDSEYMNDDELKEWVEEREIEIRESEKVTRERFANLNWPENLLNYVYGSCKVIKDGIEELIEELLKTITPTEEKIIRMYFQERKTCDEICDELDAYFASITGILSKARRKLLLPARRKLVLDYIELG